MIPFVRVTLLGAGLALLLGQAVAEPHGPGAAEIERLVKQLGSDSYRERQAASRRLKEIGEPAFAALQEAARSQDPEVRRQASELVKLVQSRVGFGAREARRIIEKAIEAQGGEPKLARYKGVKISGKVTDYHKGQPIATSTGEIIRRYPFHNRTTFKSTDGESRTQTKVLNGHKGWRKYDGQPAEDYSSSFVEGVRECVHAEEVARLTPLLSDRAYTLSLLGGTKAEAIDVIGVMVSHKDHRAVKLFFDKGTGILVKYENLIEEDEGEVVWETFLSGYRDFGGIKRPNRLVLKQDGKLSCVWEITEYKDLEEVDDREFAKP
jgi:hypothetical protein